MIYARQKFEKNVLNVYEEKYEEWKKNTPNTNVEVEEREELVGLVFKTGHKIEIELFDEKSRDKIARGKFNIKEK